MDGMRVGKKAGAMAALCALVVPAPFAGCGASSDAQTADREPVPAPEVTLTAEDRDVWSKAPTGRHAIPVLLYHGVGDESDYSNSKDAQYGIATDDFAKQMTLLHNAGYRTITLEQFLRHVRGEQVDLPAHPLLLTFDDGRADSWTNSDATLRELDYNAVLFVDAGAVDRGDEEYLTWSELNAMQDGGRWDIQLHAGRGHHYVQYGSGDDDYGPYYAYKLPGESLDDWHERVTGDIEWGQQQLREHGLDEPQLAFAPPFGSYGQDGTNDDQIPKQLLDWLLEQYPIVFTQDRPFLVVPDAPEPLGRLQVTRSMTGGQLYEALDTGKAP